MVKIKIDLENREKLRRLHTTTHVVTHATKVKKHRMKTNKTRNTTENT